MQIRSSFIGLIAVAALVTACGGGSSATAAPTAAGAGTSTVKVTLQEFAVLPEVPSVPAGTVDFEINNIGPEDVHEMVVIKSDLGARDLPVDADGKVLEDGEGMTVIGEVEDVAIGATEPLTLELDAGKYLLICNILQTEADGSLESHYQLGMSTPFEVTAP